jgi:hypothetical protein
MSLDRKAFGDVYRAELERFGISHPEGVIDESYISFLELEEFLGHNCSVQATRDAGGQVDITFGPTREVKKHKMKIQRAHS